MPVYPLGPERGLVVSPWIASCENRSNSPVGRASGGPIDREGRPLLISTCVGGEDQPLERSAEGCEVQCSRVRGDACTPPSADAYDGAGIYTPLSAKFTIYYRLYISIYIINKAHQQAGSVMETFSELPLNSYV